MTPSKCQIASHNRLINSASKTPTDDARVYIDGKLLDVTNDLFESEDEPTLVEMFGGHAQVEAFVKPTQISVRVNGSGWQVSTHTP